MKYLPADRADPGAFGNGEVSMVRRLKRGEAVVLRRAVAGQCTTVNPGDHKVTLGAWDTHDSVLVLDEIPAVDEPGDLPILRAVEVEVPDSDRPVTTTHSRKDVVTHPRIVQRLRAAPQPQVTRPVDEGCANSTCGARPCISAPWSPPNQACRRPNRRPHPTQPAQPVGIPDIVLVSRTTLLTHPRNSNVQRSPIRHRAALCPGFRQNQPPSGTLGGPSGRRRQTTASERRPVTPSGPVTSRQRSALTSICHPATAAPISARSSSGVYVRPWRLSQGGSTQWTAASSRPPGQTRPAALVRISASQDGPSSSAP